MLKKITLAVLMLAGFIGNAQTLPIDFEGAVTTADFVDFDGGIATVIANPQQNGINTSATVAQIVRDGGTIWSGSKIQLDNNLDFSTFGVLKMKVFTSAPVGTIVKFKLEGNGQTELDAVTTVSNEWETLSWNFNGQPNDFDFLVFMFDFGNIGTGSITSTFLFDDIEQEFSGAQIDLPVGFEDENVDYTMTDFGGNSSTLVEDPTNPNNHVIQTVKTTDAAEWAGTTIGLPSGFATNIPFTLTDSKMVVRVWSPDAGTPIRLKVEDSNDNTHTCETQVNTTVTADWEILEFDFTNQAPGTVELSFGLDMGWTYNMASIFFNFGTTGQVAGEKTYYFDNVSFGEFVSSIDNTLAEKAFDVFPNPTSNEWVISSENEAILSVQIFDIQGKLLNSYTPNSQTVTIDASEYSEGIYFSTVRTNSLETTKKLVKK